MEVHVHSRPLMSEESLISVYCFHKAAYNTKSVL